MAFRDFLRIFFAAQLCLASLVLAALPEGLKSPLQMSVAGGRRVAVKAELLGGRMVQAEFEVPPLATIAVHDQLYKPLRLFNPNGGSWGQGAELGCLYRTLENGSVQVHSAPHGGGTTYQIGKDFQLYSVMGQIGRTKDSAIGENPVYVSYRHAPQRLDSVVLDGNGKLAFRQGEPRAYLPVPPVLAAGEIRLGNIYQVYQKAPLSDGNLFPIRQTAYEPQGETCAEKLLPKTWEKLHKGGKLRALAWGDSITVGTYIPNWQGNRWQEQVVALLRKRFPKATIELHTVAWGGHNTVHFLTAPSGSPYYYEEKVLGFVPDLVLFEFHNDRSLDAATLAKNYTKFLQDFREIGAEWLILIPPYTADNLFQMMEPGNQKALVEDKRPLSAFLRRFAMENGIALADAAEPFVQASRCGIPHLTWMANHYNHPGQEGLSLMAQAVMRVWGVE